MGYKALASTTCDLQWLSHLMKNLFISHPRSGVIYCDNQSAIKITLNQVFHENTKHIKISYHMIREKAQQGLVKLLPVQFSLQQVNILTKNFPPSTFHYLFSKLGMLNMLNKL